MTTGRGCVLLLTAVVALGTASLASGQAASGARSGRGQTPKATVSKPGGQSPRTTTRLAPQGFSVVLVLADLQTAGGKDEVPPAARRALADLQEFLPYKSYKLLDAAWLLGHGGSGLHPAGPGIVTLRGPDDQEYEVRLTTSAAPGADGRISVRFALSDDSAGTPGAHAAASQREMALREELVALQTHLESTKRKVNASHPDVRRLEKQAAELIERIEKTSAANGQASVMRRAATVSSQRSQNRAIIDTSFTMDVGETVVVGASRLKGNSRALIALLTAVPPRPPRK